MKSYDLFLADAAPAAASAQTTATTAASAETTATTSAPAGDPAVAPKPPQPGMMDGLMGMLPFIIVIVVMFFLMSRSQKKEQKRRQEMMDSVKKGDTILTLGGLFGKVDEVKEDRFILEIAQGVKIAVSKKAVAAVNDTEVSKK